MQQEKAKKHRGEWYRDKHVEKNKASTQQSGKNPENPTEAKEKDTTEKHSKFYKYHIGTDEVTGMIDMMIVTQRGRYRLCRRSPRTRDNTRGGATPPGRQGEKETKHMIHLHAMILQSLWVPSWSYLL